MECGEAGLEGNYLQINPLYHILNIVWGGGGSDSNDRTQNNDIPGWRRLTGRGVGEVGCVVVGVGMVVDGSVVVGVGVVTGVMHFRPSSSKRAICAINMVHHQFNF